MLKMLTKRLIRTGSFLGVCVTIPSAIWFSLTYQPSYYRAIVSLPREQSEREPSISSPRACNCATISAMSPLWEAVFSDQEVNAWLAEDLVTHFADQLPPEVHDPRVLFETNRVILAFQLEKGGSSRSSRSWHTRGFRKATPWS